MSVERATRARVASDCLLRYWDDRRVLGIVTAARLYAARMGMLPAVHDNDGLTVLEVLAWEG